MATTERDTAKLERFVRSGRILGRGCFGAVYGNDVVDPKIAVKYAGNRGAGCQEGLNEYAKYVAMARRLSGSGLVLSGYAGPVEILDHVVTDSGSYMPMERIQRPPASALSKAGLAPRPGNEYLTFQLRLGVPSLSMTAAAAGHLIGIAETGRLLEALGFDSERYIEELIAACGEHLAAIHFAGLNDAYGMGVFGHYDAADAEKPLKAIFSNFSLSNDMAPQNASKSQTSIFSPAHPDYLANIERMAWSTKAYPFFPEKGAGLRHHFTDAYLRVAAQVGTLEGAAARKVLESA